MAQDASGFIWVGTAGGLARFDGYEFKNYLPNPTDSGALPDGYINAVNFDSSDRFCLNGLPDVVLYSSKLS